MPIAALTSFLTIEIGLDPNIGEVAGLTISWHGLFTALGVIAGFLIAAYFGRRSGISEDDIYNLGLAVIIGGIVGARVLYVAENHSRFEDDWTEVFAINAGGISIYGALLGAMVLGFAYGIWKKLALWRAADAVAMGTIVGMAVGRIGDIINGEHFATASSWPIAVTYTDPDSPGFGRPPSHLAVGYEMAADMIIFGIMLAMWRFWPGRRDGFIFVTFFFLYGALRLGVSFLRDDAIILGGLRMAQLVAIGGMALAIAIAAYLMLPKRSPDRAARRRALRQQQQRPNPET
jgi:phosphatidylglycerol:prolipoprotein diacylglycerol transferase